MNTQQLVDKLQKVAAGGGGWVLWLMLCLSVISLGIMLERTIFFITRRDDIDTLMFRVLESFRADNLDAAKRQLGESKSVEAVVIGRCVDWIDCGPEALSESVEAEMARTKRDLEKGMNFLGTLGNNAPFIGLMGTVLGVIQAFQQLGNTGNKDAMGNVMVGIAEALIATGVGLFVAIPAVVAFNIISKQVSNVEGNVDIMRKQIVAYLKSKEYLGVSPAIPHVVEEPSPVPARISASMQEPA